MIQKLRIVDLNKPDKEKLHALLLREVGGIYKFNFKLQHHSNTNTLHHNDFIITWWWAFFLSLHPFLPKKRNRTQALTKNLFCVAPNQIMTQNNIESSKSCLVSL